VWLDRRTGPRVSNHCGWRNWLQPWLIGWAVRHVRGLRSFRSTHHFTLFHVFITTTRLLTTECRLVRNVRLDGSLKRKSPVCEPSGTLRLEGGQVGYLGVASGMVSLHHGWVGSTGWQEMGLWPRGTPVRISSMYCAFAIARSSACLGRVGLIGPWNTPAFTRAKYASRASSTRVGWSQGQSDHGAGRLILSEVGGGILDE